LTGDRSHWRTDNRLYITCQTPGTVQGWELVSYGSPWNARRHVEPLRTSDVDAFDLALTTRQREDRQGAVRLLEYLGYSAPLQLHQASNDLSEYLDGVRGNVAADGLAVACLVSKRPNVYKLNRSRDYSRNMFVLAHRSKNRDAVSGWKAETLPIDPASNEYPNGVWFWAGWVVVHLRPIEHRGSVLRFFRINNPKQTVRIDADLFVAPVVQR
jgi:hypothetical protein